MKKAVRTIFLSFFLALVALAVISFLAPKDGVANGSQVHKNFEYAEFLSLVEQGKIKSANWLDDTITGDLKDVAADGKSQVHYTARVYKAESEVGSQLMNNLVAHGVDVKRTDPAINPMVLTFLAWSLPAIIIIAFFYFMVLKPAQSGGNQAMQFGRSKARRAGETNIKITFDDVAGIEEAKAELVEIVDFLKNTKKYVAIGAKIPKGILLMGPPGVGKTHLARAIAGEAGVPFFHISGSDFVEMFVGVGAARVRDLFETAKAHRPCLIFVDEIDAVGRQRGAGLGGGHDEREQTLNQLLVEMDGFDPNMGVIMIAATNRPDVLDPALLRPGRFDRQIVVAPPDAKGREQILKIHAKGKPLEAEVSLETIAKRTPGFTGADLANTLNEAALLAARRNKTKIGTSELEEALDRTMVGPARHSVIMTPKEREVTAYHEAGHAIVGELLEHCDPIHKVTILPRGQALGITWSLPDIEKFNHSRSELMDRIAMTLGGLVAEEVVYGERWTGAGSDLQTVTRIARAMVCEYGMSDVLGALAFGHRSRSPFLGRDVMEDRDYGEEVAKQIDDEVRRIVENQHQVAKELLTTRRETLDALTQALLEHETLDRDQFLAVLNGQELAKPEPLDDKNNNDSGAPEPVESPESSSPIMPSPPRLEPGTA